MKKLIFTLFIISGGILQTILAQNAALTINLDEIPTKELEPSKIINDDDGGPLVADFFKNLAYDPFTQRLYLGNRDEILVLSYKGKIIRRVSRRGQGPLEFLHINRIVVSKDYILVADMRNLRIQILNKDFTYYRTIPISAGDLWDITYIGDNKIIAEYLSIHQSPLKKSKMLHLYDIQSPFKPLRNFLPIITNFENIKSNINTMNQIHIASDGESVYTLYRVLPLMKKFSLHSVEKQKIRFVGEEVQALSVKPKLPASAHTSGGATPVKVFANSLKIGVDDRIYFLNAIKKRKIYTFDKTFQNAMAFILKAPLGQSENFVCTDFCVGEKTIYVLDLGSGSLLLYPSH